MMQSRLKAICFFLFTGILFFISCSEKKKKTEVTIPVEVDTTKYKKVDSIVNVIPRTALRDTILTITDDSVFALYYPNTGKSVMKLKKGDVCNITRTGRYDVVDGRGNFWVRIERYGGHGWIFGGQTSLNSDVWVFSDGMTELGHPYMKYKLNKITAPNFSELYKQVGRAIKASEYSEDKDEDEVGTRTVELNDDEIIVHEDDGLGSKITEIFKPGPSNDSIKSIIYTYTGEGENAVDFNHSFVIANHGGKSQFAADFFGALREIHKVGKNYMLVSDYSLHSERLGNVGYTNIELYSPQKKHVISRHRFANSAVEIGGYPIFKPWEDGSFIASSKATFTEEEGELKMEIFETYNRIKPEGGVEDKVFYITRYFTFNNATNQFDETRQEVIYQAK